MAKERMNQTVASADATTASEEGRLGISLFVRGISDESWNYAMAQAVNDLMARFPQYGSYGTDYDIMKAVISEDVDKAVLMATIGKEFVSRLAETIEGGTGLKLDLRFKAVDPLNGKAMRFLHMSGHGKDVATIYDWNVARMDPRFRNEVKEIERLSEWDRGLCIDGIIRTLSARQTPWQTVYGDIFRDMGRDRFLAKAMLIALPHFDLFAQGRGADERTMH